jgi:site-specific DNA recombinase
MRCAIYARYSSELQRSSSIEDQIRRCKEYAERQSWTVLDEFIRCDEALSGANLFRRTGLSWLIEGAKRKPRAFDRILVEDTSRLARDISDALKVSQILKYHGVYITAVAQGIDSEDKSARSLLTLHGMMDEQFLVGLADKVHRGQEGRVLNGFHPEEDVTAIRIAQLKTIPEARNTVAPSSEVFSLTSTMPKPM